MLNNNSFKFIPLDNSPSKIEKQGPLGFNSTEKKIEEPSSPSQFSPNHQGKQDSPVGKFKDLEIREDQLNFDDSKTIKRDND